MTLHDVLELQDLTHVYVNEKGATLAIDSLNLRVVQGEFISLVGPSGCGKTTVLSLMAGLLKPTKGEVLLNGSPVTSPSSKVGYMLQQDYLLPWRSILDNAAIGLEIAKRRTPETLKQVESLLSELGIPGYGSRYPHELSGGMRQRVALARTLATEPGVLLLDEPFSALDMHIKLQLEELVFLELKRRSKTAVLVTHDLAEAAAMSDRVIVLDRNPGRIRAELAMPDELREAAPMAARKLPGFQDVFELLWRELSAIEGKGDTDE